jgi:glycosyltransferase involved in cell wall biosynthesis
MELHRLQFFTQRVARSVHHQLKQGARDMLPADSQVFEQLRMFNAKYLEPRLEISLSLTPQPIRVQPSLPFGINVAGYIQGEFGVAEVARTSLKSLESAQVPYVLNNVKTPFHRQDDPTFAEFSAINPYRVNLVHVNADQAEVFANDKGLEYFKSRYNIGCWFWELSTFPKRWCSAFDYYQEIWVASGFCQESIASQSPIPVVKMTFPILIDEDEIRPNRSHFGLPEDRFTFGFVFDYHSLAERKNPYGLLQAFEMAFGDKKDVLLVIKTINGEYAPEKVQKLREAAQSCRANIRFIDGYIPRRDAINLVASFDSYVSLHRSEGLGIGMAQAMRLGKPVIATGYSGNMDFMNHNNSYLVRYQLTELQENYGPYEKGNVWAEPDLEHAAALIRQVYEDRVTTQQIANRAALDIKTRMTPEVTGREMKERLLNVI